MLGKIRSNTALSGCDFILLGLQELLNGRANGACQPLDVVYRNIPFSPLDGTYVRSMQSSLVGKILLGNSQRLALPPQIVAKHPSYASFSRHEFTLDKMMSLRLQT